MVRLNKAVGGGAGGAAGAETAAPLEALYKDFMGGDDFKTFVKEHYPDIGTVGKRVLMELIQFGALGGVHMSKADRAFTMQRKRNLLVKTQVKLDKLAKDPNANIDVINNQLKLAQELQTQIKSLKVEKNI